MRFPVVREHKVHCRSCTDKRQKPNARVSSRLCVRQGVEDEHPANRQRRLLTRLGVFEPNLCHALWLTLYLFHHLVPNDLDLRVLECPPLNDLRSSQLVAAVNYVDLVRIASEIVRLFNGCVTPTYDRQDLALEECTVADSAVRDSLSCILYFTRDIQSYERFFFETLSQLPGVQEVHSNIAMSEMKSTTALPLDEVAD